MPRILLVGWDAADWKVIHPLLDRGELPTLARIIEGGVSGNLSSLQPMLSPMLWTSIATGRRAYEHGIHGFTEIEGETGRVQPVTSTLRPVKALWNILAQTGRCANVVGWFATHPAETLPHGGASVSDAFFALKQPPEGSVYPAALREELADLRVSPEEIDANVVGLFVPDWRQVDETKDRRLATLRERLAECFSVHAAATHLLARGPADFTAVYYRAIDWICHDFMPFHPPAMAGTSVGDAALYGGVVSGIYRLLDLLLARLLALAGEDTTVVLVSDHGFHSDHLRPVRTPAVSAGIANWHRPTGILALRGPALLRDELIHGAGLLDLAPTVLSIFGLPAGIDMPGRVLREAFRQPPDVPRIPSWEAVPGDAGRPPTGVRLDAAEADALRKQFEAIGYLAPAGDDPDQAAAECRRENRWNLARAYLDAGRPHDALELLEMVYAERPERSDFGLQLANCQLTLGLEEEALTTLGETLAGNEAGPLAKLLLGNLACRRRDYVDSIRLLREAAALAPNLPGLQGQIGLTLSHLGAWEEAEGAFRRVLDADSDEARAHLGIAHTMLRRRRYPEAVDSALTALGLRYDLPLAHFTLGSALARLGETERAIQAFETCLTYAPGYSPAHRFLAHLYRPMNPGRAHFHREQTAHTETHWQQKQTREDQLHRDVVARADARATERVRLVQHATATIPTEPLPVAEQPLDLLIVSGLPRSGTSLMMRMLQAAGIPLLTDATRPADDDNPDGYFEWQPIKALARQPALIEQAAGRVVKVVSALLPALPRRHRYKVIFMVRPVEEIAASQLRMRARLEPTATLPDPVKLADWLAKHRDGVLDLLRNEPNVALHLVDYPALVRLPHEAVVNLRLFLELDAQDTGDQMLTVIDPARHRIQLAALR